MAWQLLKDTVNSCIEYRILGLAAEAAFFTLLSLPPLLLGLIGLLGYVDDWTDTTTVASIEENILGAVGTVLSDRGVNEIAKPLLDDVTTGGRPDVISLGFAIALWSGSRAVNVFIDTITVMYGLDGQRGIVKTRLLAFLLYVVALLIGAIVLPLMVVGPDRGGASSCPGAPRSLAVLYWPHGDPAVHRLPDDALPRVRARALAVDRGRARARSWPSRCGCWAASCCGST